MGTSGRLYAFSCLGFLALAGCERQSRDSNIRPTPCQRFVPINAPVPRDPSNPNGMPWAGAFALDTETGQACYTFKVVNHTENAMFPSAPDCNDLYLQTKATKTSKELDEEIMRSVDEVKKRNSGKADTH